MSEEKIEPPAESDGEEKDGEKKETPKGRIICSWCKKVLGTKEMEGDSHTICVDCREKYFSDFPKRK